MFGRLQAWLAPEAMIRVDAEGDVVVTGKLARYKAKIRAYAREQGWRGVTVRFAMGRFYFTGIEDPGLQQRVRNFLFAECKGLR